MRTLIITGGSGSLGTAITTSLISEDSEYDKIIIYSRDEIKQESMQNLFKDRHYFCKLRFFLGDVRDKSRLQYAMRGVTDVIHAAALKVVPALEYSPMEAVKTNIIGTQNLIECCLESNSMRTAILVSTDKAVHPVNLYGATKLAAEKLFIASNNASGTISKRFGVVRYGNVAGSRGSVIHKFKEAVANGEAMKLTHREMTRFWITLDQAADFVLSSLDQLDLGETEQRLFIPTMKSFSVHTLARAIGDKKPRIKVTGVRPGEKLHETIATEEEAELLNMHTLDTCSKTAVCMFKRELQTALLEAGLIELPGKKDESI